MVDNLHDDATEQQIVETFKEFGMVLAVTIRRKPGKGKTWALVSFADPTDGRKARTSTGLPDGVRAEAFDTDHASASTGLMGPTLRAHHKVLRANEGHASTQLANTLSQPARRASLTHPATAEGEDDENGEFSGKPCKLRLSGHFLNYHAITLSCDTRETLRDVKEKLAVELSEFASEELDLRKITDEITVIDEEMFPTDHKHRAYNQAQGWPRRLLPCMVAGCFLWNLDLGLDLSLQIPSIFRAIGTVNLTQIALFMMVAIVILAFFTRDHMVSATLLKANKELENRRKAKLLEVFKPDGSGSNPGMMRRSQSSGPEQAVHHARKRRPRMVSDTTAFTEQRCVTQAPTQRGNTRFLKLVRHGKELPDDMTVGRCGVDSSCTHSSGDHTRIGELCPKCMMTIHNQEGLDDGARVTFQVCESSDRLDRSSRTTSAKQKQIYATLPTDVKDALKSAGLLKKQTEWEQEHKNNQAHDMLLWSCAIADESLAKVFWERSAQPIYAALVASAVCENLHESIEQNKKAGKEISSVADESYSPKLHELGTIFKDYADEMITYTLDVEHKDMVDQLGMAWHRDDQYESGGNAVVEMAFMDLDDDESEKSEHAKSKHRHPALREHINRLYDSVGGGLFFYINAILWFAFLWLQYTYVNGVVQSNGARASDSMWLHALFFWWCCSLTIETAMKHLGRQRAGRKRQLTGSALIFFHLDVAVLSVFHVSFWLQIVAAHMPVFKWCLGLPVFNTLVVWLLPALLRMSCLMAFIRILHILSGISGVRVVVNMMFEILRNDDNISFIVVLVTLALSFGVAIYGIEIPDNSSAAGAGAGTETNGTSAAFGVERVTSTFAPYLKPVLNLIATAFDYEAPEGSDWLTVFLYCMFLLIANTYLVEGFLIGMINEKFGQKDLKENL
jgi:hypothetical protein